MTTYRVFIDAAVSDEIVVRAKNAREAKRKALKRFAKLKNFHFDLEVVE